MDGEALFYMNEWEFIKAIRARVADVDGVVGIGDDAAVLPDGVIVTTDTFVQGVHFRPDWASWKSIGAKAAQATISDIAAMGGRTDYLFANLSAPGTLDFGEELLEGILSAGVPLLGGDTTRSGSDIVLTLTALGRTARPVLRSGAKVGDRIYISGPLGGSEGGYISKTKSKGITALEERFFAPMARLDIGVEWGRTASAMIDISDGLSSELNHISKASSVALDIVSEKIPYPSVLSQLEEDPVALALRSGEEFELLATSSEVLRGGMEIGVVREGEGVFLDGRLLEPGGYTHSFE